MGSRGRPRHILITGASGGIGAELAKAYAAPDTVLGLIGRNAGRLAAVATACEQQGAIVVQGLVDVTDLDALAEWIRAFDAEHPVDLAIANAGVTSSIGEGGEAESWEAVRQTFDVNLYGAVGTVFPLIEPMRARGSGQLVFVSSLAAYIGMPLTPSYSGSKAAVKVYGEALRGWLAPQGVKVSVVLPGFVASDMSDRFRGPKPFLISARRSAAIIRRGVAANRARIGFPFPLNLGVWLLSILPASLSLSIQKLLRFE